MRVLILHFFLTFVLCPSFSVAAPTTKTNVTPTPYTEPQDLQSERVPVADRELAPLFLLNVALGYYAGNYLEQDSYEQGAAAILRVIPLQNETQVWDYQLELGLKDIFGIGMGRRWYCCPHDEYQPYARLSGHLIINAKDEFAGLVEIRRWRARAAVGLGQNWTSEFGVGLAVTGPDLFAQFGYNIAF